jgi:DNA-binding IscR family transcriptional regulator
VGLVESRRGAGAGWRLARDLEDMTLLDVYRAVEPSPLFSMHNAPPNQECVVGAGIQPALRGIYDDLEDTLRAQLARTTLAEVLRSTLAPR